MIDLRLHQLISEQRPRMNYDICNGIAKKQIEEEIEPYINNVFLSASESLTSRFQYIGMQHCTPLEEFREAVRPPKPCRSFELSKSNVYMVKLLFRFDGREMRPRYVYLPYLNDGDIIYLKGTQYKVTPVIGGRAFNVDKGKIYMAIGRARMYFDKTLVSFILNERVTHADAVYSPLYNLKPAERSKLPSLLVHYLLAEFGLVEMFKRYFKIDIEIGEHGLDNLVETGEWMIFRSRQMAPVGRGRGFYNPSNIRIGIKACDYKPIMNSIIGAVFYIIDNCADSVTVEDTSNPEMWLRLLPKFVFKTSESERKMFDEMTNHLKSIRYYMDPITKNTLARSGIICRDIFDLLHFFNVNFHDIVIHHDVGSMYNQELSTTKYLSYHIVHNIFMMMFDIMKLNGDRITFDNVTGIMDTVLKRDKIFTIGGHGELSADGIATDCKPYAATCNMITQSKAASAGKKSDHSNAMLDPSLLLHHSQVEVATYQMMSKAEPTGRSKCNPFVYFGERSFITANPNLVDYINNLKTLLTH